MFNIHNMKAGLLLVLVAATSLFTACNDDWTEEQYTQYVSFRAPLNEQGVTSIYVPYSRKDADGNNLYGSGKSSYNLPIIVSGSNTNGRDITVHVAHDPDTLATLNYARFQNRRDLWYSDMNGYATFSETAEIKSGENTGLLNLSFDFNGIDMVNKWVLPLTIVDDQSYGYTAHPRKNYAKAMLRIFPFNDFSGDYNGTTEKIFVVGDEADATTKSTVRGYVVDDNTIFFYAGDIDEDRTDRAKYKVFARFNGTTEGTVDLYTDNELINLQVNKQASFRIIEQMDEVQPYLMHRYVVINNIDYTYEDYTSVPNYRTAWGVNGTLTLERQINTQIPDEDQAIQWITTE